MLTASFTPYGRSKAAPQCYFRPKFATSRSPRASQAGQRQHLSHAVGGTVRVAQHRNATGPGAGVTRAAERYQGLFGTLDVWHVRPKLNSNLRSMVKRLRSPGRSVANRNVMLFGSITSSPSAAKHTEGASSNARWCSVSRRHLVIVCRLTGAPRATGSAAAFFGPATRLRCRRVRVIEAPTVVLHRCRGAARRNKNS
jgi:hypothetical protein